MDQMTVGRALKEIKLLDSRIEKQTNSAAFVDAYQKKSQKLSRQPVSKDIFEKNALAEYDSVVDLISRRNKIKTAILISNATQKVKVDGVEYVVIEAIERKRAIELDQALLAKMRTEYKDIVDFIANNEAKLKEEILKLLEQSVSSDRIRDKGDYEKLAAPFREDNEVTMVDPLSIKAKIDALDSKIDKFLNDIDYVLSESNATVKIDI